MMPVGFEHTCAEVLLVIVIEAMPNRKAADRFLKEGVEIVFILNRVGETLIRHYITKASAILQ